MRASSRAVTPGRPTRRRPEVAVRRTPPRPPLRLAGTTAPPAPEERTGTDEAPVRTRRSRRRRVVAILTAVGVLVLLVEGAAIVRTLVSDDPGHRTPRSAPVAPLIPPADLPARGGLVQSEVRADGTVAVTQWIRDGDGIEDLSVAAPAVAGAGGLRVTGARLVAGDGSVLADDVGITATPRPVPLRAETTMVRATYVLRGAAESSDTVEGRVVVQAVSLDLTFPAQTGPTLVVVAAVGGGVVRNLACANAHSPVALLRPCGAPDGSGWRVRLPPGNRDDRVAAQVDVRAGGAAARGSSR